MKSTFLKVVSIVMLVLGIIALIAVILGLATLGLFGGLASVLAPLAMPATIVGLINCIVIVVAAIYGIIASKKPEKCNVAIIFGIIMIALAVVAIILSGVGALITWTNYSNLILPVLYLIAAILFKKKAAAN